MPLSHFARIAHLYVQVLQGRVLSADKVIPHILYAGVNPDRAVGCPNHAAAYQPIGARPLLDEFDNVSVAPCRENDPLIRGRSIRFTRCRRRQRICGEAHTLG